jgi:hypothetical protein
MLRVREAEVPRTPRRTSAESPASSTCSHLGQLTCFSLAVFSRHPAIILGYVITRILGVRRM